MRTLIFALLPLLLALPLKAQTPALSQLQLALDAAQSSNPGAIFEGSGIRRPSNFVVVPAGRDAVPATPFDEPQTPRDLPPETKRAAADLEKATGPEGSAKNGVKGFFPEPDDCDGFFECLGAAVTTPLITPVVLGMAYASMGVLIGDEKAGTFGMIVGGIVGGLFGFLTGIFVGLGDAVKTTFKAFGLLLRGKP